MGFAVFLLFPWKFLKTKRELLLVTNKKRWYWRKKGGMRWTFAILSRRVISFTAQENVTIHCGMAAGKLNIPLTHSANTPHLINLIKYLILRYLPRPWNSKFNLWLTFKTTTVFFFPGIGYVLKVGVDWGPTTPWLAVFCGWVGWRG